MAYGCATFIDLTISTWSTSYSDGYSLTRVFITFLIVLGVAAVLNIFSGHLMALMNNASVWWHVIGAAAIVLILIFVPDQHQSFSYVFTERFNNSGYGGGSTSNFGYWFAILPFGFLLTQYTITGFDASAHLSEETARPPRQPPRGSGSRSSTRSSAATSCCSAWCSRFRTPPTVSPTTCWQRRWRRSHLRPGHGLPLGRLRPVRLIASASSSARPRA